MTIIKFDNIKLSRKVKGTCLKCDKERVVTIVSEQTVNPFNKNEDGTIKNRLEVFGDVKFNLPILCDKWKSKFICKTCYKELPWGHKWFN